ncbi:hypothetical protein [Nocardioides sambongensis]|nr:hypothetical protein [Nocardioides sambongensis]
MVRIGAIVGDEQRAEVARLEALDATRVAGDHPDGPNTHHG